MAGTLALFDFDGTITDADTMFVFCRHARGTARFAAGLLWLSPMLLAFKVGLLANDRAKMYFLSHFLGGSSREDIRRWADSFVHVTNRIIRPGALERLQWHAGEGHEVFIVSASLDLWLAPWAQTHNLRVLCTEASFTDDRFTGALATANCNGPEKVQRIRSAVSLDDYDTIYAYGDSSGDDEMLALATHPTFRPFRGPVAT
jgi:phosphatidylglycerophosphatase C